MDTTLALLLLRGESVLPRSHIRVCRDPGDDLLLEIAVEGKADYLVSGDHDLQALDVFEGIPILGPAAFLEALNGPGA